MKKAFLVSKKFGIEILRSVREYLNSSIVIHPQDSDDPRSCMKEFNDFCRQHNLDFLVASTKTQSEQMLADFSPDIIFVCGWYWIIPDNILNISKMGVYGIHHSLLPMFRGGSPLVWSIIEGGEHVGSTLFKFDSGMDTGDIAYQFRVDLNRNENIGDALKKIETRYSHVLPEVWKKLIAGELLLTKQAKNSISYRTQRTDNDGRIDWHEQARKIHDFCRAQLLPYPCTYTFFLGRKVRICKTSEVSDKCLVTPGQIIRIVNGAVYIGCGESSILAVNTIVDDFGNEADASTVFKKIGERLH